MANIRGKSDRFIFLGSKINADDNRSYEIKRHLLLGRKAMRNLDSILKSREFANKGLYSQRCGFSSSHIRCEKAKHQRFDAFKLWCWRTVENPLDCKESKPVNPKGINPEYSLEGLMLKLKLQYFGHLMQRANSLEKTLMLEKI